MTSIKCWVLVTIPWVWHLIWCWNETFGKKNGYVLIWLKTNNILTSAVISILLEIDVVNRHCPKKEFWSPNVRTNVQSNSHVLWHWWTPRWSESLWFQSSSFVDSLNKQIVLKSEQSITGRVIEWKPHCVLLQIEGCNVTN